jgi:hypothetical protein
VTTDLDLDPNTRTLHPIRIDRGLLQSGGVYVLQIRLFRGRPDVSTSGFQRVEYPQAVSTIFTRTIAVP